jgi:hypothetical protein
MNRGRSVFDGVGFRAAPFVGVCLTIDYSRLTSFRPNLVLIMVFQAASRGNNFNRTTCSKRARRFGLCGFCRKAANPVSRQYPERIA